MPTSSTPRAQLDAFIAKFNPEVAAVARAALRTMEKRLPAATRIVYDNYNALAIGFGPSGARFRCNLFDRRLSTLSQPVLFSGRGAVRSRSPSQRHRQPHPSHRAAGSARSRASGDSRVDARGARDR